MTTAVLPMLVIAAILGRAQDPAPPKNTTTYVVVVNAKNAATETGDAAKAVVKKLFLKDLTQWPDGAEAKPYRRPDKSGAHDAFQQLVLGMSDAELARHWLRVKNQDGTTPPKEVDSDRMVLKYVARYPGAFGIVPKDAVKGVEGVRVLIEL
ncbi:MAG: hypothetical protein IPK26_13775 [Planctomycetes bacterium]|nr:hypothetical protein [Planctomycetota bacterium]